MDEIYVEHVLNGRKYVWDGDEWCDAATFATPADAILQQLYQVRGKPKPPPAPVRGGRPSRSTPAPVIKRSPPPPPKVTIREFVGPLAALRNDHPVAFRFRQEPYASINDALARLKAHHDEIKPGAERQWLDQLPDLTRRLMRGKFAQTHEQQVLLGTGEAHLVFGDADADLFWGMVDSRGENHLGRLLVEIRDEISRSVLSYSDDLIQERIAQYAPDNRTLSDDALRREETWERVLSVYDLYRDDLDARVWQAILSERDRLLASKGPG